MALAKRALLLILLLMLLSSPFSNDSSLLAQEKAAHLVTLDWPPYIGPALPSNGFVAEIVREAFARVGYRAQIDFLPWNRALYLTERGDYDGLIAVYYTKERDMLLDYHDTPLGYAEIVLMELSSSSIEYTSMEDLIGYKIGVARGFAYPAIFEEADFLERIMAVDTNTLIKLLLGERVDLIVEDRLALFYLLQEEFGKEVLEEINVVDPPLERKPFYLAFSGQRTHETDMLQSFNRGLLEILEDGTYEEIMGQYGM